MKPLAALTAGVVIFLSGVYLAFGVPAVLIVVGALVSVAALLWEVE